MVNYNKTVTVLIGLICYMPIIDIFLPKTNFGVGIPDFDATRLCSYLLLLVFIFEIAIYKRVKLINGWILSILCFTIITCTSPMWSKWYSYTTQVLQNLLDSAIIPLIIALIVLNVFQSKGNIHRYMKHIIIAGIILSIISIYQFVFNLSEFTGQTRASATMSNPNLLAVYLVSCIPCVLYCIEKRLVSNKVGLLSTLLIIGGILGTVSRKGIGTMIICFMLYYLLQKQFRKVAISITVFTLLAVLLSGYAIISNRFTGEKIEEQFKGKWNMTVAGFKMYKEKPILGNGYNGYHERFGEFFPNARIKKYDAHNEFITALADFGIFGFMSFVAIFLYPLNYARKVLRRYYRGQLSSLVQKDMAVVCICTIVPFMISAFSAGALFSHVAAVFILYANISFVFMKAIEQ